MGVPLQEGVDSVRESDNVTSDKDQVHVSVEEGLEKDGVPVCEQVQLGLALWLVVAVELGTMDSVTVRVCEVLGDRVGERPPELVGEGLAGEAERVGVKDPE